MPLTQSSLDLLVCPVCHAPLLLTPPDITCTACHRQYPIHDDLPILIATRATLPLKN